MYRFYYWFKFWLIIDFTFTAEAYTRILEHIFSDLFNIFRLAVSIGYLFHLQCASLHHIFGPLHKNVSAAMKTKQCWIWRHFTLIYSHRQTFCITKIRFFWSRIFSFLLLGNLMFKYIFVPIRKIICGIINS